MAVSRRYENRISAALSGEENPDVEGRGYKDIGEQLRELDPVVDVVWISGTRKTFLYTCYGLRGKGMDAECLMCSFSTGHFSSHHRPECNFVAGILPIHAAANVPVPAKDGSGFFVPAEGRQR